MMAVVLMTASQPTQPQNPKTAAAKWNSALVNDIINTCASSTVTY